ncbi:unnamed protein product [Lasius platythorax]|uniref:Uncharacterized protein n=1 Tax=Lasius platythorax TaxID=488582 RepID=A0AAV2N3X8_9HYME
MCSIAHSPPLWAEIITGFISFNQATFSHSSSLQGQQYGRAEDVGKRGQPGHQGLHDSAIRESTRGFRRNDPLRSKRVISTMTAAEKGNEEGGIY